MEGGGRGAGFQACGFKGYRFFFLYFFCVFSVVLLLVSFPEFLGASGGVPGDLLRHFFVKKHKFNDFGNTSKSMAGAVFQQV